MVHKEKIGPPKFDLSIRLWKNIPSDHNPMFKTQGWSYWEDLSQHVAFAVATLGSTIACIDTLSVLQREFQ